MKRKIFLLLFPIKLNLPEQHFRKFHYPLLQALLYLRYRTVMVEDFVLMDFPFSLTNFILFHGHYPKKTTRDGKFNFLQRQR